MAGDVLAYTVLVYEEPQVGFWVKIPEFDLQCLATAWAFGLCVLEEELSEELSEREEGGELIPEKIRRTVKRVGKAEYGPTERELGKARYLEELAEEYEDEEPGPPVVILNVRSEPRTNIWVAELPGIIRGTMREVSVKRLMLRARVTADRHLG